MKSVTRLYDMLFSSSTCSMSSGDRTHAVPRYVSWERAGPPGRVAWYTDGMAAPLPVVNLGGLRTMPEVKVKWLLEPRDNHPENFSRPALEGFDVIYTHDPQILAEDKRARAYVLGGTRIHESDWGHRTTNTSAPISIVASPKRSLEGHQLRHQLIEVFDFPTLKAYGPEYNRIRQKFDALERSLFHVAIEPVKSPGYLSEHLLDAILTMNYPIYWGASKETLATLGFSLDGMTVCESYGELVDAINRFSKPSARLTEWYKREGDLVHNFRVAHAYTMPEDHLYRLDPTLFEEPA